MPEIKTPLSRKAAGEAAELAFMARAAALGLVVSKPLGDNASYDVIVGSCGRLLRVQVKSSAYRYGNRYSVAFVQGRSRRPYVATEIDFLVVCIRPLDVWYVIPVAALGKRLNLHFNPERSSGSYEQYRERWDLLTHPARPHA